MSHTFSTLLQYELLVFPLCSLPLPSPFNLVETCQLHHLTTILHRIAEDTFTFLNNLSLYSSYILLLWWADKFYWYPGQYFHILFFKIKWVNEKSIVILTSLLTWVLNELIFQALVRPNTLHTSLLLLFFSEDVKAFFA